MPRLYPALIAVLLLGLLAASPASARVGHCLGGKAHSRCHIWTGRVTFVADGDTLDVRLGGRKYRIRMTGINAQELRVYSSQRSRRRGECHAIKATEDLIHMVHRSHNRVRLYAQNPHSHSGKRTRRAIGVKIGGHWVDAGARQIASGNALWLPNIVEQAWNREYSVLSQQAALTHRGMFNPRGCGRGPAANARLRLWVNWEAKGAD